MAELKSVVKDTAIYGLSSIIGRFLNYLLVPLYTAVLPASSGGYGIVTNIYAYVGLVLVILTFGMETTFFRFANKKEEHPLVVYSTTLLLVGIVSLFFLSGILGFLPQISAAMGYASHPEYIGIMGACVALDAFLAIPFAWLRFQKKALKFAALNLLFICLNIGTNLLYFLVLPKLYPLYPDVVGMIYNPGVGVGYIFGLNLVCKAAIVAFFIPELTGFRYTLDIALAKRMLRYAWPILVLGIAGILNQTADKIIFPLVYGDVQAGQVELGIYGACVKIAMIMAMITQAFRYAYEPFVFGKANDKDSKSTYAQGMKFFIIFTLLAFLCVMAWLDGLKYIVAPGYWEGLRVVPIVMAAEIMMGIYFNLSFWYKLIDKTIWGAWFSLAGCAVLLAINLLFIPKYGYMACAWGGFAGYGTAMLLSYIVGQRKNPIAYPMRSILTYVVLSLLLTAAMLLIPGEWNLWLRLTLKSLLILPFVLYIVRTDFPLKRLPVIGKYFK